MSSTVFASTVIFTRKRNDYQQIDIFDTPEFGRVLTLDGNVVITERDEFIYDEMITHIPMAVHPKYWMSLSSAQATAALCGSLRDMTTYGVSTLWKWTPWYWKPVRMYLPENASRLD